MNAAYFDGEKMTFDENYLEPNSDETLVRVNLAGICGTDLEIIQGYMKYAGILGHEFVGTVEKSENLELIGKRVVGEINAGCGACEYYLIGLISFDQSIKGLFDAFPVSFFDTQCFH